MLTRKTFVHAIDIETYSFTPTSIGIVVTVKCACGSEIDVTGEL